MAAGIDGNRRNVKGKRNVGSDEVSKSEWLGGKKRWEIRQCQKGKKPVQVHFCRTRWMSRKMQTKGSYFVEKLREPRCSLDRGRAK